MSNSQTNFKQKLEELNEKISNIRKNITYLDIYNIIDVCEDQQNFSAQSCALVPNSSLVINCDGFYFNNERYETGDLVLKMANNKVVHIKAQTGGIFYPSSVEIDKSNNLNITYSFSPIQPWKDTTSDDGKLAEKMTFNGLNIKEKTNIYGLWQSVDESFDAKCLTDSDTLIEPYIKFYLVDENSMPVEEICLDYKLELDSTNSIYSVTIDSEASIYMKVK